MSLLVEERPSASPYVDAITWGRTLCAGAPIRPAEVHWHMVIVRHQGETRLLVVGPWSQAGVAQYGADAEIVWIRFTLGTFIPHLPTRQIMNHELPLPGAASNRFYLQGAAWEYPTQANADTFIARLVRDELLVHDPLVDDALQDQPSDLSPRTVRHRFLQATGMSQNHIRQFTRAQQAAALLQQGMSILDTVDTAGYYDQPHLTRALKHFIGYTPAQLAQAP